MNAVVNRDIAPAQPADEVHHRRPLAHRVERRAYLVQQHTAVVEPKGEAVAVVLVHQGPTLTREKYEQVVSKMAGKSRS